MPVVLTEATEAVADLIDGVLRKYFYKLAALDPPLAIQVLMAEDAESLVPLKEHGRGVSALIKRAGREERATGGPDVRILIDAMRWKGAGSDRVRSGILARQIRRIEVQYESDGKTPKTDDAGRYGLRLAKYDWVVSGFRDVVEWFGDDAPELRSLRAVEEFLGQKTLPFGEPDPSAVVSRVAEIEREEERASA